MNSLPIDHQNRIEALNSAQSFIVQAPAGSGKTYLLTQRYLKLLAEKCSEPESILALTFTNKAANEMRARILNALKKAKENAFNQNEETIAQIAKKALQRDQELQWNILDNPQRLRIQTLDAFSLYLAQQLPITSRFGTATNISNSPITLYQKAARQLLQSLKTRHASLPLQSLVLHLDNDYLKLEKLLSEMLSHRDQWLPLVLQQKEQELIEILNQHLAVTLEQFICEANDALPQEIRNTLLPLMQFANCLSSIPEASIDYFQDWQKLSRFLLTQAGEWRKSVNKNHGFPAASNSKNNEEKLLYKEMKQRMENFLLHLSENNYSNLKQCLHNLQEAPPYPYQDHHFEIIEALFFLLPLLTAELMLIFKEQQCVDFIEIQQRALLALGDSDDPSDITLKLDHKIEHLLVDEFQDTSITQFQLLKKITQGFVPGDGRTIFLVGDPMQSIYGFRAAEVGLFLQVKYNGIGDIKPKFLQLQTNFRSLSPLVQFYNQTFIDMFPRQDNIHDGAISYASSVASKKDEENQAQILSQEFNSEQLENQFIIEKIKQIQECYPNDSIAILVQKRFHLKLLLPLLQQHQISYQAVDIENLFEKSLIHDLFALTRALLFLHDRIAWLSVLRAPWCGLTLDDLHAIANVDSNILIWERLQDLSALPISTDAKIRLTSVVSILSNALTLRNRKSLRTLIENTWYNLRGHRCLNHSQELEIAEQFFSLLEAHEYAGDILDLHAFEAELNKLYASSQTNNSKLQIMTIHKSKGLEFDHVFFPFLNRNKKKTDKKLLMWLEKFHPAHQKRYLIFAPLFSKQKDKELQLQKFVVAHHSKKNDHEQIRLMYVAYTRAKKSLYLSKTTNEAADDENKNIEQQNAIKTKRLSLDDLAPAIITENKKSSFYQLEIADTNKQAFGILVHQLLQHHGENILNWKQKDIDLIKNKYVSFASQLERVILNLQNDPNAHWIFNSNHQFIKKELSLTGTSDGKAKVSILDRTFVDQNNIRWIIDFKTATVDDTTQLTAFLQQQQNFYRSQLEHYAKLFKQLDSRPIHLGLYFPLIPQFCYWQYQTQNEIAGIVYGEFE